MGLKFECFRVSSGMCGYDRGNELPDIDYSKPLCDDPGTDPLMSICFTACCGCGFFNWPNIKYIFETLFCRKKDLDEKVGDRVVNPDFPDQEAPMKVKMKQ